MYSDGGSLDKSERDSNLGHHQLDLKDSIHVLNSGKTINFSIQFANDSIAEDTLSWVTGECVTITMDDIMIKAVEFTLPFNFDSGDGSGLSLVE
jgi:hypothetical protein